MSVVVPRGKRRGPSKPREPSIDWRVESFRLSAFTSVQQPVQPNMLDALTGVSPEDVSERPGQLIRQERAKYRSGQILAVQQPRRLDVILNALQQVNAVQEVPIYPDYGSLSELLDVVPAIIRSVTEVCNDIVRVAVAPVFLWKYKSEDEVRAYLSTALPMLDNKRIPLDDFAFHYNNRGLSSTDDSLSINRLTKWNVAKIQYLSVGPGVNQATPIMLDPMLRLEVDANTPQEHAEVFKARVARDLFEELFRDVTRALVPEGDK